MSWLDIPHDRCKLHPSEFLYWRCKHCQENLCRLCIYPDPEIGWSRCLACQEKIVESLSPAPQ